MLSLLPLSDMMIPGGGAQKAGMYVSVRGTSFILCLNTLINTLCKSLFDIYLAQLASIKLAFRLVEMVICSSTFEGFFGHHSSGGHGVIENEALIADIVRLSTSAKIPVFPSFHIHYSLSTASRLLAS